MIEVINSKGSTSSLSKISPSDICYVNAYNVDNKDLDLLSKTFGISTYILKNFLDQREIPRIDKTKFHDLIILKCLLNNKVKTLGIIKNRKYVLTVCGEKFETKLEKDYFKDTDTLLKRIIYEMIKDFYLNIEKIEEDVNYVEDITFDERVDNNPKDIFKLKKQLFYRKKALSGNKSIINEIKGFEDINIELNQLLDVENTLTTRLTGIMEMYMSFTSNKLNQTMKGFTIIASLILIPTLISGIYGMNVILPLGHYQGSFYIILGMMLVSITALLSYFKIKKWI
jgi:magnesium transporter